MIVQIEGTATNTTKGSLSVSRGITNTPNTASFIVPEPDSIPLAGQDVLVIRDTTANILFGGIISSVEPIKLATSQIPALRTFAYAVECLDYSRLLNQRLVIETFVSQTAKQIIENIVANFTDSAHGFTTNNVDTGRTISRIVFNYVSVAEAIQDIANLIEFDWFVDDVKDIHFFERRTISAPFNINDTTVASSTGVNNFSLNPDYSQVRNRVWVRGGTQDSDNFTQEFVTDGEARIWSIKYADVSSLSLTLDTGSGPVAQTVAIDYLNPDDGTFDFLWNSSEKYIRAGDFTPTATPANGNILRATYKFKIPIIVRSDNVSSQAAIAAIEGGDGIYEHIIRDETIDSRDLAMDRAQAETNEFGDVIVTGGFTTYEHGFDTGQFVNVNVTGYTAFEGNYQIQRVDIRPSGAGEIFYNVTFASTLYELKDLLLSLIKEKRLVKLRQDEIVDVLILMVETVTIIEGVPVTTLNSLTDFVWDEFTWDLGTWQ